METQFIIPPTVTCGELNAAIRHSDLPLFDYFFSFNEDGTTTITTFARNSKEFVSAKNFDSIKKLVDSSEGFVAGKMAAFNLENRTAQAALGARIADGSLTPYFVEEFQRGWRAGRDLAIAIVNAI